MFLTLTTGYSSTLARVTRKCRLFASRKILCATSYALPVSVAYSMSSDLSITVEVEAVNTMNANADVSVPKEDKQTSNMNQK